MDRRDREGLTISTLLWLARRGLSAVAPCLVAASLLTASCDTLRSATGWPGERPQTPAGRAAPPVLRPPPAAQPQDPGLAQPPLEDIQAPQEQQVKVALVLPLTGRLANLGQAMSEASQMAMFDLADRRFELIPLDDQGTPKGSEDAARQAVAQGARIILGPLLASSVRAVTPIAAQAGIPVVAFSSDRKVASPGIYVIGFTPEAEVERVVAYATSRGLKRFAALAPDNDPYGAAVADALRKAVASNGGTVVRIDFYDAKTQDFSAVVRKLTGAPDPAAAPASSPFGPVATSVPPVPAFDALLIAEGGPKLRTLGATLGASGIGAPGVQLLGTGKWDEPGIGAEPSLVGAWFAAPAPAFREEFEVRYKQAFGKTPPRLATLAYDATALAAVLARGPGSDPFSPTSMVDTNGFFGRDGLFRLTADGAADRRLAILRVERNGVAVVDEPARSFAAGS